MKWILAAVSYTHLDVYKRQVFKIGPRINASGRIQNGKEAVELLIEKDFSAALEKANQIVDHLEGLADRRSICLLYTSCDGFWTRFES